ncbi:MAG: divergent polysaccharide deacetylase family protein [Candidatus Omnitrophica bacterium]|nr:divergent polysaccharide deacetylase family protein [Candidatus Omnitrophota bacterium]
MKKLIGPAVIFLLICVIFFFYSSHLEKKEASNLAMECDKLITSILEQRGIDASSALYSKRYPVSKKNALGILNKEYLIPYGVNLDELKNSLIEKISGTAFKITKIKTEKTKKLLSITLTLSAGKSCIYQLLLNQQIITSKIAIVLDDWGYSNALLRQTLDLNIPITFAILPGQTYSEEILQTIQKTGHEAILHLPLEPHNTEIHLLEKNTILTSMPKEEILRIFNDNIKKLPGIKGLNNHMGSFATENKSTMSIILDEAKKHNLYFLDSYTSKNSIIEALADEKHIPFLKRDIFLDDNYTEESIKNQLIDTKNLATSSGSAIAIGHVKPKTIEIIKNNIRQFKDAGVEFVYLSGLLNKEN